MLQKKLLKLEGPQSLTYLAVSSMALVLPGSQSISNPPEVRPSEHLVVMRGARISRTRTDIYDGEISISV